jgi:3',5'-cyclic AMP phosphodiesterase CpdA
MDIWNQFKGPKYHVIGNHDVDGGFTHGQVVEFWNAKGEYYSFDMNNYHFVVLNANERSSLDPAKGYPRSITHEQLQWLKQDLDSTRNPVIIFCHQGIDNDMDGVIEGDQVRIIFERANQHAGFKKVRLVISGHHHEDYHNIYNGINYVQINSISYQFNHLKKGYSFALTQTPLWALITVYSNGTIEVNGKKSSYIDPIPTNDLRDWDGYPTVPTISDRIIKI